MGLLGPVPAKSLAQARAALCQWILVSVDGWPRKGNRSQQGPLPPPRPGPPTPFVTLPLPGFTLSCCPPLHSASAPLDMELNVLCFHCHSHRGGHCTSTQAFVLVPAIVWLSGSAFWHFCDGHPQRIRPLFINTLLFSITIKAAHKMN